MTIMKNALLIVASPFQLMNARAAISYFQIKEYKLYILKDNDSDRHKQIANMAEYYHMEYELIDYMRDIFISKKQFLIKYMKSFFCNSKGTYDMIIHGDYRNVYPMISFYPLLRKRGAICFVDDGNATINVLKGKDVNTTTKVLYLTLKISTKLKRINSSLYYTIYDDLKTELFNIIPNHTLKNNTSDISDNVTYIIGTNTILHADYNAIPLSLFLSSISNFVKEIKNNCETEKIIFLPHGRDLSQEMPKMCTEYDIEYKKLDECVEFYFAKQNKYPKTVYGFGSSALFNLKKMFPYCECINLYVRGFIEEHNKIFDEINVYYKKHGIMLKELTDA